MEDRISILLSTRNIMQNSKMNASIFCLFDGILDLLI